MSQTTTNNIKMTSNLTQSDGLRKVAEHLIRGKKMRHLASYVVTISFYWTEAIPTAAAGSGYIFWNPEWYKTLNSDQIETVMAHEIWHLVLLHQERSEGKNHEDYNRAADYVINLILTSQGFNFTGLNPLLDSAYKNHSTDEVYEKIHRTGYPKKKPNPFGDGAKTIEEGASERTVKDLINQAAGSGKPGRKEIDRNFQDTKNKRRINEATSSNIWVGLAAGCVPGNEIICLHEALELPDPAGSGITYQDIFDPYMTYYGVEQDYSYKRPSRRGELEGGILRPSLMDLDSAHNGLAHLVYALDISGSIYLEMANQFHRSVKAIKKLLNPKKLTVLFFNTKIVSERVYDDTVAYDDLEVQGCGGTSLTEVYARTAQIKPEALVIFTDLEVYKISPPIGTDIIWLVPEGLENKRVPYGKIYAIPDK